MPRVHLPVHAPSRLIHLALHLHHCEASPVQASRHLAASTVTPGGARPSATGRGCATVPSPPHGAWGMELNTVAQ